MSLQIFSWCVQLEHWKSILKYSNFTKIQYYLLLWFSNIMVFFLFQIALLPGTVKLQQETTVSLIKGEVDENLYCY